MANLDLQARDIHIANLEQHSIHTSGKVQPHGVLLVLSEPDLKILQASSNTKPVLGIPVAEILGKSLEDLFDPFQVERLQAGLAADNLDFVNPTKVWLRTVGDDFVVFDSIFHRNRDGLLILELEPAVSQESNAFLSFYHLARVSINQLQQTTNLRDFCGVIVQEIRKITGFDRVLLYKFDEDNHGSVIAEEKRDGLESYLGLHYPESDIPKPARQLFSANWIRIIPDTHAQPAAIVPAENPLVSTLDLTHSILRSASPCHIEYLHNMGVGASLTISLIKDQKIWGLIACHHQTPKYVSYELRKACEFLGRVIFSEISEREETEDYDYRMRLTYIQSTPVDYMS